MSDKKLTELNIGNRQVAWFETFAYASRFAAEHGLDLLHDGLPIPGTPRWCGLPDGDARKLLSLLLGGVREALAHDVVQEHLADASREISSAAQWSKIGRGRGGAYIPQEKRSA